MLHSPRLRLRFDLVYAPDEDASHISEAMQNARIIPGRQSLAVCPDAIHSLNQFLDCLNAEIHVLELVPGQVQNKFETATIQSHNVQGATGYDLLGFAAGFAAAGLAGQNACYPLHGRLDVLAQLQEVLKGNTAVLRGRPLRPHDQYGFAI
jgi:hypothetical protein